MGLWELLFGRGFKLPEPLGKVWLTEAALWDQLKPEIKNALGSNQHVILVVHFPERWEQLQSWLEANQFKFEDWQPQSWERMRDDLRRNSARIWLLAAHEAPLFDPDEQVPEKELPVIVIATERHPHPDDDLCVARITHALQSEGGGVIHCSLESPLLQMFAASLIQILRSLGMREDECIQADMVDRQIATCQRRIAGAALPGMPAESSAEWIKRHGRQ